MTAEDVSRLARLRDAGLLTEAEFAALSGQRPGVSSQPPVHSASATAAPYPPSRQVAAGGESSRLGALAGTAAAALAGAMAGGALGRMLHSDSDAVESHPTGDMAVGPSEVSYLGYTEYVDLDGDGDIDASFTQEALIVDDGTPEVYVHTEYTEYVDTDHDGTADAALTYGETATYEVWDDTPADDWSADEFDI